MESLNTYRAGPDERGHFGIFGGRFVAETLMPLILEVERAYDAARADPAFQDEIDYYAKHYVGRPSPLYHARRLSEHFAKDGGGAKIYFKRDELNHTGAHKINNCMGQILLARRMGKTRIIAETGAGQHGVATATVCALFDLPCVVYMGETDIERQAPNVFRMKLLWAPKCVPVKSGSRTLKDAMNEALRDWVANVESTFYIIGTAAGPASLPRHGARFPVGDRRGKCASRCSGGWRAACPTPWLPASAAAPTPSGCSIPSWTTRSVRIIGVEAAGHGIESGAHAASLTGGGPGVLHGNRTYLLQDDDGQILEAHSISAGLDYPGIGPEHSWLHDIRPGRLRLRHRRRGARGLSALLATRRHHSGAGAGPCPGPRGAHRARPAARSHLLVMNLCGRGDKDVFTVAEALGGEPVSAAERRSGGRVRPRIPGRIGALRPTVEAEGRGGLVTFFTAGDPDGRPGLRDPRRPAGGRRRPDRARHALHRSHGRRPGDSGGRPAGPASRWHQAAARSSTSVAGSSATNRRGTRPIVLMGYFNPIYSTSASRPSSKRSSAVGVDGLIIVDLPPEEDEELCLPALAAGVNFIRLATPTTDRARAREGAIANTSGFLYYVSITGITGTRSAAVGGRRADKSNSCGEP